MITRYTKSLIEKLSNRFRTLFEKVSVRHSRIRDANEADLDFSIAVPLFDERELQDEWEKARLADNVYQAYSTAAKDGECSVKIETSVKTSLFECHLDERGLLHFRQ
jgi:hypothetical protein